MIEVDKTLKSFFESDVFTSLNEPQKLSVASVMHVMYETMRRKNDKPMIMGEERTCDPYWRAVHDQLSGL